MISLARTLAIHLIQLLYRYLEIHFDALQLYNNPIIIIRMIIIVKEN